MPANVIQKGGDYFTKGTETGLSSWSNAEQKKKERKAAYEKWLREREHHKKKVVDVPEHDEIIYKDETYVTQEAWTETKTVHHDAEYTDVVVDDLDEQGNKIGEHTEKKLVKDAWDETVEYTENERVDTGEVDEDGKPIYKDVPVTKTKTVHHDAEYGTKNILIKDAWDETVQVWVVDKPAHYEYEKGWRKGDRP